MFNDLALPHPLGRGALAAAALAVVLMSGCGGDDDAATEAQRPSTAAVATSPSTSPDTAPAAASSSSPASRLTTRNCPVTAREVSQLLGVVVHAIGPTFATKVSCAFGAVDDCPCGGGAEYANVAVVIGAGAGLSVAGQRASSKQYGKLTERPALGTDAFVLQAPGQRGHAATFPTSGGAAVVDVSLGPQDASNRVRAGHDAGVTDRIFALVARRMT